MPVSSTPPARVRRPGMAWRPRRSRRRHGHGVAVPAVAPIATADWPTRAKRPADSRLDCGKLAAVFGLRLPPWQDGLARTVEAIFAAPRSAECDGAAVPEPHGHVPWREFAPAG